MPLGNELDARISKRIRVAFWGVRGSPVAVPAAKMVGMLKSPGCGRRENYVSPRPKKGLRCIGERRAWRSNIDYMLRN